MTAGLIRLTIGKPELALNWPFKNKACSAGLPVMIKMFTNLLRQKKFNQPLGPKKIAQPLGTKKLHNLFGQKNHATS